jgi:hypothetical protein
MAKIQQEVNPNPGGFIKRASMGGIKFILTYVSEERGVRNGHIQCADFISMN